MEPSILPEDLEEETIAKMAAGDTGFVVPWAIAADNIGRLYIRGDYHIWTEARGTIHVKIERTKEGVIVYRDTLKDAKYRTNHTLMEAWQPLPVFLR